jgi:galactose mutarotase-like enzyme
MITIANDHLSVIVSPLGAEMQSITTRDGQSWLWNGDPAFWTGRSPILFPIVGKARGDQLTIEGKPFSMGQHGFARRSEWTLAEEGPGHCRFVLEASAATRTVYPFDFMLSLEHRLEGRAVSVSAEVSNRDSRPMPFGIGFHPAFLWPLPDSEGLDHTITLDNGAEPDLIRLQGGLVENKPLPSPFSRGALTLGHELFTADAMIFPDGAGAGLRYAAGQRAIHFTWTNLPNLAIWSKPDAPFICLEPWHGTAALQGGSAALEDRPFTDVLGPGATSRYGFKAELIG